MQTLEQRVQSNTDRIAALEAKVMRPALNTPQTHPMYRPDPNAPAQQDPDANFVKVFGRVRVDGEGRVLDKWEETTWNRRLKSFNGFAVNPPQSDAVDALLDHYEVRFGIELKPEFIGYGGEVSLVFPNLPGLGYGTPQCFVLAVSLIEKDFGLERKIDLAVDLIEQRRAK